MNKEMKLGVIKDALIVKFIGDVDNLVCSSYKNKLETIISENKYKKVIMDFSKIIKQMNETGALWSDILECGR